jgi:cytochrome bd-type quinol oxidase subunit 2
MVFYFLVFYQEKGSSMKEFLKATKLNLFVSLLPFILFAGLTIVKSRSIKAVIEGAEYFYFVTVVFFVCLSIVSIYEIYIYNRLKKDGLTGFINKFTYAIVILGMGVIGYYVLTQQMTQMLMSEEYNPDIHPCKVYDKEHLECYGEKLPKSVDISNIKPTMTLNEVVDIY